MSNIGQDIGQKVIPITMRPAKDRRTLAIQRFSLAWHIYRRSVH